MATYQSTANPLSRLTADPVLRAFFNRSAPPPPAPAYAIAAPKPPRLTDGVRKALPRVAEIA